MTDLHKEFQDYYEEIRLTAAKRTSLKDSREANRNRIRKHFKDVLKKPVPKFHGQGSYMMKTNVNHLADGEYDIDDGVYLQGLGTDESQWPSSEEVHGWVYDAVKDATDDVTDKPNCVRVRYARNYHIDLPIYALDAVDQPKIFKKKKDPELSDPRAFTDWFTTQVSNKGDQIRRIVRYLKGWRDFKGGNSRIASGVALTVLACNHYVARERDDEALVETVKAMVNYLSLSTSMHVYKPTVNYDCLSCSWTAAQRRDFISALEKLRDKGQDALDEEERSTASGIWRKLFGERFPEVKEEDASSKSSPATPIKTPRSHTLPSGSERSASDRSA